MLHTAAPGAVEVCPMPLESAPTHSVADAQLTVSIIMVPAGASSFPLHVPAAGLVEVRISPPQPVAAAQNVVLGQSRS